MMMIMNLKNNRQFGVLINVYTMQPMRTYYKDLKYDTTRFSETGWNDLVVFPPVVNDHCSSLPLRSEIMPGKKDPKQARQTLDVKMDSV